MKNRNLIFLVLLFLQMSSSFAQISSGSGGGGNKPSGPILPADTTTDCEDEDDVECIPSISSYRESEKELLPYLAKQLSSCVGLPVHFNNILEFYNHTMIKILVGRMKIQPNPMPGCHGAPATPDGFISCLFKNSDLKFHFLKLIYAKKGFVRYLQTEYNLNEEEALEISNFFFQLRYANE